MTSTTGFPLAPLGRRTAAWLLDACLGALLAAGFVTLAGGEHDVSTVWHLIAFKSVNGQAGRQLSAAMHPTPGNLAVLRPILGLLAILTVITAATVGYRVITTAKWGAGLGKTLLGLKVVIDTPDHCGSETPGWARAWKRWAVPMAPGLIPLPATGLLAYTPALRDHHRRGLHDRAAGTIVIDVRSPLATTPPAQRLAAADDGFYVSASART
jgi:uncharacterized RDD family membrane protein YckC